MSWQKKSMLLLLVLLPLVAAGSTNGRSQGSSSASQSPCDRPSAIRGSIQTVVVAPQGTLIQGSVLLDGTQEQQVLYKQVSVSIAASTRIYLKSGQECQRVSFSALQRGKRIQVQATGPVAQSFPPQLTADEVVILPDR